MVLNVCIMPWESLLGGLYNPAGGGARRRRGMRADVAGGLGGGAH